MKMIIRSYKAQKLKKREVSLYSFKKSLFSASFSSVGCISDVVLLEKDKNRMPSLNVGLVQVKKGYNKGLSMHRIQWSISWSCG